MSATAAASTVSPVDPAAVRDWEAVRAASDIQFTPLSLPQAAPPAPPGWLQWLGKLLQSLLKPLGEWLGVGWPVIEKVAIALALLAVLALAWRIVRPLLARRRAAPVEPETEWRPHRAEALALLQDADRLAAEGCYDEAVHLLLRRSVGQIDAARPGTLAPAATAREIAVMPTLPEAARATFAVIAERVERSLFALRALGQADWQAARAAYADFARVPLA